MLHYVVEELSITITRFNIKLTKFIRSDILDFLIIRHMISGTTLRETYRGVIQMRICLNK